MEGAPRPQSGVRLCVISDTPRGESGVPDYGRGAPSIWATISLSAELAAHPVEFAANIVDNVAGLEIVGQHVPRIGFDLELA
jgi:hypothetical protein